MTTSTAPQGWNTQIIEEFRADGGTVGGPYAVTRNPRIDVEVGTETFAVDVHELDPQERARVWPAVVAANPGVGEYQQRTDRMIPLLRLAPVA